MSRGLAEDGSLVVRLTRTSTELDAPATRASALGDAREPEVHPRSSQITHERCEEWVLLCRKISTVRDQEQNAFRAEPLAHEEGAVSA